MFLIPKKNIKNFNTEKICFVLNEFSSAEFSSAVEMLFAAKKTNDVKLSISFIKHCLDEYKHYSIFMKIKNKLRKKYKINRKDLNFVSNQLFYKGYLDKNGFLYEKKKLSDFSLFIGVNEEIAEKKLLKFYKYIQKKFPDISSEIKDILEDEQNHAHYSLNFSKKKNNSVLFYIKFLKEKMFGHLRHFYADRLKNLSFIFYPILIFIILAIYPIIFFLNLKNNNSDQDVMKNIDPAGLL